MYGAPIQVELSKEKAKNCDNFREVSLTALISMELQYKLTTMRNVLMARVSPWGSWDWDTGLDILAVDKWELRKDLGGVMFRASSAHDPPYVAVVRDMDLDNLPRGYKAGPSHWQ